LIQFEDPVAPNRKWLWTKGSKKEKRGIIRSIGGAMAFD